jgi:serine/threonine-protein kinase
MTEGLSNTPSDSIEVGQTFAGKYTVTRKIGEGGFGSVYLVENEVGWKLALKVLHGEVGATEANRKRFLREMSLARELVHENSVPVRDAGVESGRLYYTMDFVAGEDMGAVIKREHPIAPERIVSWGVQVLRFLAYFHGRGYVHRDLKPANLMLMKQAGVEHVRVLDLGIAKAIQAEDTTMLSQGLILGTPPYMSPEHLLGDAIDYRTDLYALGVILYEAACGARPFRAPTVRRLREQIITAEPPPIVAGRPDFPEGLEGAIFRALEKDPENRYSDAAAFLAELERAGGGGGAGSLRTLNDGTTLAVTSVGAGRRRRRGVLWLTLGALALAVVTWLAFVATRDAKSGSELGAATSGPEVEGQPASGPEVDPAQPAGGEGDEEQTPDAAEPAPDPKDTKQEPDEDRDPPETKPGLVLPGSLTASGAERSEGGANEPTTPPVSEGSPETGNVAAIDPGRVLTELGLSSMSESAVDRWGYDLATPVAHDETDMVLHLVPATDRVEGHEAGFRLGAIAGDAHADPRRELPVAVVRIARPYYMAETEVTHAQWERVASTASLPRRAYASWNRSFDAGAGEHFLRAEFLQHPVVGISWEAALAFCAVHPGMGLPTEAQWSWVCRLEAPADLYLWGSAYSAGRGRANARHGDGLDEHTHTAPARSLERSRIGLFGLMGNVNEYCHASPHLPPIVPGDTALYTVARGGSWKDGAEDQRISRRFASKRTEGSDCVGFRVVLEIPASVALPGD